MTEKDIKHFIGRFIFWLLKKICDKIVKKFHLNLTQFLSICSNIFLTEKNRFTILESNEKEVREKQD